LVAAVGRARKKGTGVREEVITRCGGWNAERMFWKPGVEKIGEERLAAYAGIVMNLSHGPQSVGVDPKSLNP
jgi:hypothetical protein